MSSLVKKTLILGALLALSACGFSPLYAEKSSGATASLDNVRIDPIPDRDGQYLRNALMDRFYRNGTPVDPAFTLRATPMDEQLVDLDLTKTSTATRRELMLSTVVTLRDNATNEVVLERTITSRASFNVLQSQFTTRVSEQSVRENALDDMARQIETQLALYFSRQ